jgi:hypothetical protein
MPLSWRIEKFILSLWHAAVVIVVLSHLQTVDYYKFEKWLVGEVGETSFFWITSVLCLYTFWQLGLFFLHMGNALSGEFHIYFNNGTFMNFIRTQIIMSQSVSIYKGQTEYHNINRVMDFRESRMGAVGQREAADILVKTSMLDAIATGAYQGHNARRAAENLNSRLGAMGQRDGLKYLMNKKD